MRRTSHRTELVIHDSEHFFFKLLFRFRRFYFIGMLGYHESKRDLPLHLLLNANHRYLRNILMTGNALFNFTRTQAMTCDIDYIIGTAQNEVIAVRITNTPIESRVHLLGAEV